MSVPVCNRDSVCAIVVTYHPDNDLPARIARVATQARRIVVVDNGSSAEVAASLESLRARYPLDVVLNEQNRGVATALNQGVTKAKEQGFSWALLLDQDTVPVDSMTATLCRALLDHPRPDRIAVVGSNYIESANQRQIIPAGESGGSWVERSTAITSGSMIAIPVFDALGGFRDELFIDDVDTEYCFRARAHGFHVIVTTAVTMEHTIGDAHQERQFLWRTVRPVNYSPVRWYYIARNTVVMTREFWRQEPRWVSQSLYGHTKWVAKALIFEPSRLRKAGAMLRGAWDGLRGRLGPAR